MAGRGQEIKIIVHTPSKMSSVFCAENVEGFWAEKISAKIKESGLTKQELLCLFDVDPGF